MNSSADNDGAIDLYAILKIEPSASVETIQKSYKALSRNFHPDKRRLVDDKASAEDYFVSIKLAHDILSDPVLRLAYDHGGMEAVDIVRRSHLTSQQQDDEETHHQQQQQNEEDGGDGGWGSSSSHHHRRHGWHHNESGDDEDNLYHKIQNARNKAEAVKFIRQMLDEYKLQRSITQKAPIVVQAELIHAYDPRNNELRGRGLGSLRVQATRPFGLGLWTSSSSQQQQQQNMELSLSGQTQVQRRPQGGVAAARTTSVGFSYRPDAASQHHVECALNQTSPLHSQWSLQTTRRFVGGNMVSIGVGGSPHTSSSTMYTVTANRVLMLGSLLPEWYHAQQQQQDPKQSQPSPTTLAEATKVHMSWTLGTSLSGTIGTIAATLRNLTFPQFKLRVSLLDSPPIKVTYDSAEEESWHAALSWDASWWRLKVTKEQEVGSHGHWSLTYGFKFDTRGIAMGQAWSILLHLQSHEDWHLRIPITIRQWSSDALEWPVTGTLLALMGHWLHEHVSDWRPYLRWLTFSMFPGSSSSTSSSYWYNLRPPSSSSSAPPSSFSPTPPMYVEMIAKVAAKKRLYESQHNGLVMLQALWRPSGSDDKSRQENVTDILQFWVVNSELYLPVQQSRWWSSSSSGEDRCGDNNGRDANQPRQWSWNWLQWLSSTKRGKRSGGRGDGEDAGALYVRYRLDDLVYEIWFQGDELVWIPNHQASLIGPADRVH